MNSREAAPSDAVVLERAKSFCNEACFTVALQCRRLQSTEPEDKVFMFRWHADLQFLIVALRRLRSAAELAATVHDVSARVRMALDKFDRRLPGLARMCNVGEHLDDYVVGKGHNRKVRRGDLQVNSFDGSVFKWLGVKLDIDVRDHDGQRECDADARYREDEERGQWIDERQGRPEEPTEYWSSPIVPKKAMPPNGLYVGNCSYPQASRPDRSQHRWRTYSRISIACHPAVGCHGSNHTGALQPPPPRSPDELGRGLSYSVRRPAA